MVDMDRVHAYWRASKDIEAALDFLKNASEALEEHDKQMSDEIYQNVRRLREQGGKVENLLGREELELKQ